MIEIVVAIAIVVLIVIFLTVRKRKSPHTVASTPVLKPVAQAAPIAKSSVEPAEPVVKIEPEKPVVAVATVAAEAEKTPISVVSTPCCSNKLLPQDSVLKRHYLYYVQTMVIELHSACPTDATLHRHYDGDIAAKVAECVTNETALQQLLLAYETNKKTQACPVVQAVQTIEVATPVDIEIVEPIVVIITPAKVASIPEDSVLRRHYLTQIHELAAAKLPARPTDSTLRRHYDTLLAQEVKKQLAMG